MKLLLVTHSMSRTGAPKVVVDIANYFAGDFEVSVLSVNNHDRDNRVLELNEAINFQRVPDFANTLKLVSKVLNFCLRRFSTKYQNVSDYWFSRFLDSERPSLIIFNTFYHANLQRIAQQKSIPQIRYIHENSGFLRTLSMVEKNIFNSSSLIIGCSPSVIDDANDNGIRINPFFMPACTDELLEIASLTNNDQKLKKGIITVGSDGHRKGFSYAAEISAILTDYSYSWYGRVDIPSDNGNIHCQGMVSRVPYEKFKYYFLTSVEEPWPISVLEACAHRLTIFGWEHLSIIQELSDVGLAVSVKSFDTDDFVRKFYQYKDTTVDPATAMTFLQKFLASRLYGDWLMKNMKCIVNKDET